MRFRRAKRKRPVRTEAPRLKLGDSCEIKSKALVRLLYRDGRWEIAHSYRVPGRIVTEQNLIEFDLRQAIQLERKETNTAAAEKNAG